MDGGLTIAESGAIIGTSPSIDLTSLFDFYVSEYLIATYGKEKDRVPQGDRSKWLDNLFCKRPCKFYRHCRSVDSSPSVTHYAEGSVQPVLVRRLLCRTLPQTGPDLMRMDETMNAPDLKKHGEHVRQFISSFLCVVYTQRFQQIEAHLQKTGGWFAGGDNPTSADYMMTLTVEIFLNRAAEYAGENMKKYIQRVQDRCVL